MRDIDVFMKLLGLPRPWRVDFVDLDADAERVDIILDYRSNARFRCPECGVVLPRYDHAAWRRWRHQDHGSWMTWMHARVPRVSCLLHGVRHVDVPWALRGGRCTLAFEKHAIDTLLETDVLGASRLLRIGWDEAWGFMERAVERGLEAKTRRIISRLGVDEKAVAKRHQYVTLVNDLDRGTVEFIADGRKKASLDAYYDALTVRQKAGIFAVAMDMSEAYISSTIEHIPAAESKIVFDRFHVMKHMTEAVDAVRREEHKRLRAQGDETLNRTRYLWLFSEENLPERYADWFARLKAMNLKTGRAWAIKESLRTLWSYRRKGWARRREFLHVGGLSALGLTLADALQMRAEAVDSKAMLRNCILIWLDGGPSHLDTFDLKPEAPAEVRGQLKPIPTSVSGIGIGEHFKKLFKQMDKVCIIRSLTSELGVHGLGSRYVLTGYKPSPVLTYPSFGSVVAHSQKVDSVLPFYVALANARLLSYGALDNGYLPESTRLFTVTGDPGSPLFRVRDLQFPAGLTESRLDRRRQYVSAIDNLSQRMEREGLSQVRNAQFEKAYRLILSTEAKKAFELSQEKPQVRTKYGMQYRRYSQIGQSCLLARRLIEAGCRFVTVTDAGRGGNYDMHSDIYGRLGRKLPVLDQAVSALIEDLETRGLLDETLVVLMGEFGRTPRLNGGGGRDHWPRAFSVVLAGGGVRGGQVVGKTDPRGTSPVEDPATPADLARTIYTLIGIDPGGKFHTQDGRPIHINSSGDVIKQCLS